MNGKIWGAIIGGVFVLMLLWGMSTFNGLVSMNEEINTQWSQVENQMKRRADLLPNLVDTVKGVAKHEQSVIDSVTNARNREATAKTPAEKIAASQEVTRSINMLIPLQERYPELKANQNFTMLMAELAGTENRLAVARNDYNKKVNPYNQKIKSFPANLVASSMGFAPRDYFKVEEADKVVPKVNFNN